MSRRRNTDEAPVSLFSFQDIITSVSGIMLFLVLMFALQMARQSAVEERPPPRDRSPVQEVHPDRTRMIRGLLAYLDNLKLKSVSNVRLQDREAADLTKISRLQGMVSDVNAAITNLQTQIAGIAGQYADAKRQLDEQDIFAQIASGTKEPFVVLCSEREILCGKLMTKPERFAGDGKEVAFMTYLARRPGGAGRTACLFLLKPSSATYAWPLVKSVQRSGWEVGWQPWGENKPFRFEKGTP